MDDLGINFFNNIYRRRGPTPVADVRDDVVAALSMPARVAALYALVPWSEGFMCKPSQPLS